MARANLRDTQIRAALETIAVELAIVKDAGPIIRLRVDQAAQRTGLSSLLDPVVHELDQIGLSIGTAQAQVNAALAALTEKDDAVHVY